MASGTRERALAAAVQSFGSRGYDATSLDDLAAGLGVTKQAILYHFASKESLLAAAVQSAGRELAAVLDAGASAGAATGDGGRGFARIERVVRAAFGVAAARPELLGLIREVSRQGEPHTAALASALSGPMDRAQRFLATEMDAGRLRRHDPALLLLAVYSAVVGVATEPEVMRALGVDPTVRSLARARRQVLTLLQAALVPEADA